MGFSTYGFGLKGLTDFRGGKTLSFSGDVAVGSSVKQKNKLSNKQEFDSLVRCVTVRSKSAIVNNTKHLESTISK